MENVFYVSVIMLLFLIIFVIYKGYNLIISKIDNEILLLRTRLIDEHAKEKENIINEYEQKIENLIEDITKELKGFGLDL